MERINLRRLADEHLALAGASSNGRSSTKLVGDHHARLRSNLIALTAGAALQDHESPGEATLQVLRGEVEFHVADENLTLAEGDLLVIPRARHGLRAVTDSVAVLTVVKD